MTATKGTSSQSPARRRLQHKPPIAKAYDLESSLDTSTVSGNEAQTHYEMSKKQQVKMSEGAYSSLVMGLPKIINTKHREPTILLVNKHAAL